MLEDIPVYTFWTTVGWIAEFVATKLKLTSKFDDACPVGAAKECCIKNDKFVLDDLVVKP